MPERYNKIRNADFSKGAKCPTGWTWDCDANDAHWSFVLEEGDRSIRIASDRDESIGWFTQRIRCKAEHWYRIEAVVTADCPAATADEGASLVAIISDGEDRIGDPIRLAVVSRTNGPVTLRGYIKTPPGTRAIELYVGLHSCGGFVTLHSALCIENIEPDLKSHPLAHPPPQYEYAAPKRVRKVCVCDDGAEDGPLVELLRARFGRAAVLRTKPSQFKPGSVAADAVIFTGNKYPRSIRSLDTLEKLAADRIVIVPLEMFAHLASGAAVVRTVEQPDDPTHGQIVYANFITRGLALHDSAPWATTTDDARVFRQRHLRKTGVFKRLCKQRGYEIIIDSETDHDSTSGHPICLFKPTDGGGVIVFDLDPLETSPTSRDECNIIAHVLLNMLGDDTVSLGQYAAPEDDERRWLNIVYEIGQRYRGLKTEGKERHETLVHVGAEETSFGLPMPVRPVILIRTGLSGSDHAGIYGVAQYLKQLVRRPPFENPYAKTLVGKYRLVWSPLAAAYAPFGTTLNDGPEGMATEGTFEHGAIAAVIDVVDSPVQEFRVIYNTNGKSYDRHAGLLRGLAKAFAPKVVARCVANGSPLSRRDESAWRAIDFAPAVSVSADVFTAPLHASAAAAGATLIRIETPGLDGDFACNSIWRTDYVALTLEHVIGALYGVLAVNRKSSRVVFGQEPPLKPGEALMIDPRQLRSTSTKRVG